MLSTTEQPMKLSLAMDFPSENETLKSFIDFADNLGLSVLTIIGRYAMAANASITPFTESAGFEWLDNCIVEAIYHAAEEEEMRYANTDMAVLPEKLPAKSLLAAMERDINNVNEFYDFLTKVNKFLHYHYGHMPFPDNLEDFDPFFQLQVKLLNPQTMILEITDADDIEQFTSIY